MCIETYLKIRQMTYKEYREMRFKEYEKKYGSLKQHEFVNMLKCTPENFLDNDYYFKYIKAQSE